MADLRQIRPDEWRVLHDLAFAAFTDLEERQGDDPIEPPPDHVIERRFRRVIETDPGGAWVAEEDGRPVGAGLAILREGLWGLSMLVVHPDAQSGGVGRALLDRALKESKARGHRLVVLVGDEPFYGRVGFKIIPKGRATMPGPVDHSRLLVAELVDGAFTDVSGAIGPDWSMAK